MAVVLGLRMSDLEPINFRPISVVALIAAVLGFGLYFSFLFFRQLISFGDLSQVWSAAGENAARADALHYLILDTMFTLPNALAGLVCGFGLIRRARWGWVGAFSLCLVPNLIMSVVFAYQPILLYLGVGILLLIPKVREHFYVSPMSLKTLRTTIAISMVALLLKGGTLFLELHWTRFDF